MEAIDKKLWLQMKYPLANEMNHQLKSRGIEGGDFDSGDARIDRLLALEAALLMRMVRRADEKSTHKTIGDWLKMKQETRWEEYTKEIRWAEDIKD